MPNVKCDNVRCAHCVDMVCTSSTIDMVVHDGFSICNSFKRSRKDDRCWVGR